MSSLSILLERITGRWCHTWVSLPKLWRVSLGHFMGALLCHVLVITPRPRVWQRGKSGYSGTQDSLTCHCGISILLLFLVSKLSEWESCGWRHSCAEIQIKETQCVRMAVIFFRFDWGACRSLVTSQLSILYNWNWYHALPSSYRGRGDCLFDFNILKSEITIWQI